jgi:hypothetical protein
MLLLLKIIGFWLLFVVIAILNAGLREKVLHPWMGHWSLPMSGVTLSVLIFGVTVLIIPLFGKLSTAQYWLIGGSWLMFTLAFEFLFGHYGQGKPWPETLEIFNVAQGNLMTLVLIITLISPYLASKLRNL